MTNEANEGDSKAEAEAEHKAIEVWQQRRGKSVLDILIYICAALVIAGGLWLGYLGVSGHIKSQRITGLWVLYGTLFFVLTGAFIYFHQRIRQTSEVEGVKPELVFLDPSLDPLTEGKPLVAKILMKNISGATAYHVRVCGQATLMDSTFKGSPRYAQDPNRAEFEADAIRVGGGAVIFMVAPKDVEFLQMTKEQIEAINSGLKQIVLSGTGEYKDSVGNKYPLNFCFLYHPAVQHLVNCPPRYEPQKDDPNADCD